jgi:hypothetical protein
VVYNSKIASIKPKKRPDKAIAPSFGKKAPQNKTIAYSKSSPENQGMRKNKKPRRKKCALTRILEHDFTRHEKKVAESCCVKYSRFVLLMLLARLGM